MPLIDSIAKGLLFAGGALAERRTLTLFPGRGGATIVGGGEGTVDDLDGGASISFAGAIEDHPVISGLYNKLVRELSTLGVGVYRRERGPDGVITGRLNRVYGTTLETLLEEPAPRLGLVDLLQWTFGPALAEGNSTVGMYRPSAGAQPTGLLPLDWRYMSAFASPGGPVEAWLAAHLGFNDPRILQPEEVIHTAWRAPSAGAIGIAPLKPLARSYRLDDAARRFLAAHLRNGARPAGALTSPNELKPAHKAELRSEVNKTHGGVDNAFRIAILDGGLDWKPLSFSAADAQLDQTRHVARDEFCVQFDVRWSQLADTGGAPGNPSELARDLHRSLRPWARLASSAWQRQLVDPDPEWRSEDLVVRFDFRELLRGSPQEEANRAVHLFTNGITALDEGRDDIGLPPTGRPEDRLPLVPHAQLQPGTSSTSPAPDARRLPASTDPDAPGNQVDRGPTAG